MNTLKFQGIVMRKVLLYGICAIALVYLLKP